MRGRRRSRTKSSRRLKSGVIIDVKDRIQQSPESDNSDSYQDQNGHHHHHHDQNEHQKVEFEAEPEVDPSLCHVTTIAIPDELFHLLSIQSNELRGIKEQLPDVQNRLRQLELEVEKLRKDSLRKTLLIFGLQEPPRGRQESNAQTEQTVKYILAKLNLKDVLLDNVSRMGKKAGLEKEGKIRPIAVTTVRSIDYHRILKVKRHLQKIDEFKGVYINGAKTQREQQIHKVLRAYARELHVIGETVTTIRNSVLKVTTLSSGASKFYSIGDDGRIDERTTA